jgi:tetratricopeptide (TPR) repeat protein
MPDIDAKRIDAAIGLAASYISRGDLVLADFICRDVLAAAPGHAIAFNLIGAIAAQLGLHDEAIACFEKALACDPPFLPAEGNLQKIRNARALAARPQVPQGRQFLLIKAWGYGFWSDVSHVLGCLLLAEMTGRVPVTHWGRNSLFTDGSDGDAFRLYFEPLSALTLDALPALGAASFFPPKWSTANLHEEDNAKWQGPGSKVGGLYFLNRPETIAVSDFYIGVVDLLPWIPATHKLHGKPLDDIYHCLAETYLRPRDRVSSQVEEFYRRHISGLPTLAVHVRGSDKRLEIADLDRLNRLYFDAIDREDPSWRILLLTDDTRCVTVFRERYGDRVIVTDSMRTDNDLGVHYHSSVDRVRLGAEVMRDTYLALRCEKFIGNGHSNVSAMGAILKRWDPGACVLLVPSQLHKSYRQKVAMGEINQEIA